MKYINTALPNFDAIEGQWDCSNGDMRAIDNISLATGIVNIQQTDKIYVKTDWKSALSYKITGKICSIYLENNNHVDMYFNGSSDYLTVDINGSCVSTTYSHINDNMWRNFYLIINTKEGTIDFYLDKYFKEKITNDKIKNSKVSRCEFYSRRDGSVYSSLRNIIISDERVSLNEILYELPLNMLNNTFEMNNNGVLVSNSAGSKVTYKADITEIDKRFRSQFATLVIPETQASVGINSIKVNFASKETIEILQENGGRVYVDRIISTNEELLNEISIETV